MSKIALCWELGSGLGHVTVLGPLAHYYIKQGHEVICFLKTGTTRYRSLFPDCVQIHTAPCLSQSKQVINTAHSYSELLWHVGYAESDRLSRTLNEWRQLIEQHKCDIIVADHSPTARLAAHSLNINHVGIGTGFCCPPPIAPYPEFDLVTSDNKNRDIEQALLRNINLSLQYFSCPVIKQVCDIFSRIEDFLCTLPHLDHYRRTVAQDYWGPVISTNFGHPFSWPDQHKYKIFCYLKSNFSNLASFAKALNNIDADKVVYIEEQDGISLFDDKTVLLTASAQLESICSRANLVISHGGHNLTAQLLMAGVPNLLMPMFMEQSIFAHKLSQQGLCSVCFSDYSSEQVTETIVNSLNDQQLYNNAKLFSQHYCGYDSQDQLEELAEAILELNI